MPKFVTIGYGDQDGYDRTEDVLKARAHEHDARLAQIRIELERATQDTDIDVLRERLAKLSSSLAVIHVGGATEPELKEKFRRTEGAVAASRAAVTPFPFPK